MARHTPPIHDYGVPSTGIVPPTDAPEVLHFHGARRALRTADAVVLQVLHADAWRTLCTMPSDAGVLPTDEVLRIARGWTYGVLDRGAA